MRRPEWITPPVRHPDDPSRLGVFLPFAIMQTMPMPAGGEDDPWLQALDAFLRAHEYDGARGMELVELGDLRGIGVFYPVPGVEGPYVFRAAP